MGLLSWLFGPRDNPSVYKPRELLIYEYFTGEKMVKADPMVVWKKIMAVGPELDIDIKLSKSAHTDAPKGHESVIKKIRSIFDLKPFEEGGLPETETAELLDHFMIFCASVQKKTNGSPTPAEATSVSTASSPTASPPISKPLDSGSIANATPIDEPKPSVSEPVLPSAS